MGNRKVVWEGGGRETPPYPDSPENDEKRENLDVLTQPKEVAGHRLLRRHGGRMRLRLCSLGL